MSWKGVLLWNTTHSSYRSEKPSQPSFKAAPSILLAKHFGHWSWAYLCWSGRFWIVAIVPWHENTFCWIEHHQFLSLCHQKWLLKIHLQDPTTPLAFGLLADHSLAALWAAPKSALTVRPRRYRIPPWSLGRTSASREAQLRNAWRSVGPIFLGHETWGLLKEDVVCLTWKRCLRMDQLGGFQGTLMTKWNGFMNPFVMSKEKSLNTHWENKSNRNLCDFF